MANKRVTRDEWLERVRAWKSSGLDAAAFVKGKRFSTKALRWWAWKLATEGEKVITKPARVTKKAAPIEFIEIVAPERDSSGLLVRVGRVEVDVQRHFDVETLGRVLDLLEART